MFIKYFIFCLSELFLVDLFNMKCGLKFVCIHLNFSFFTSNSYSVCLKTKDNFLEKNAQERELFMLRKFRHEENQLPANFGRP
ncbi:hypothetical protein BpHYR1_038167 [Brachionus plicatilis]|uniref:Secreted protein n=1 Tax=Brachionus plicatilis TaxID=10195 RepID=A0A3M7Q3A0_BRAPC|nr:hypothetical protein BpHYR1_038167 [Brachionus plicatilis]